MILTYIYSCFVFFFNHIHASWSWILLLINYRIVKHMFEILKKNILHFVNFIKMYWWNNDVCIRVHTLRMKMVVFYKTWVCAILTRYHLYDRLSSMHYLLYIRDNRGFKLIIRKICVQVPFLQRDALPLDVCMLWIFIFCPYWQRILTIINVGSFVNKSIYAFPIKLWLKKIIMIC